MKLLSAMLAFLLIVAASPAASAQQASTEGLKPVLGLVGDWTGIGEGDPGTSAATRHIELAQGGHYVMVEGRSVYPKQEKNKSGEVHTSMDFWSFDAARNLLILRQFDSLGFVSTYVQDKAASKNGRIVVVSESLENVPKGWKARYTFEFIGSDEYREHFELDPDGKGFQTYVLGKYLRDK